MDKFNKNEDKNSVKETLIYAYDGEICIGTGLFKDSYEYKIMTDKTSSDFLKSFISYKKNLNDLDKLNIQKVIFSEDGEVCVGTGIKVDLSELDGKNSKEQRDIMEKVYIEQSNLIDQKSLEKLELADKKENDKNDEYIVFDSEGEICVNTGLFEHSDEYKRMSDDELANYLYPFMVNKNGLKLDENGDIIPTIITYENGEICVGTGYKMDKNDVENFTDKELYDKVEPILAEINYLLNEPRYKKESLEDFIESTIVFTNSGELCIGIDLYEYDKAYKTMSNDEFEILLSEFFRDVNRQPQDKTNIDEVSYLLDEAGELCVGTGYKMNMDHIKNLSEDELREELKPILSEFYNRINEPIYKKVSLEEFPKSSLLIVDKEGELYVGTGNYKYSDKFKSMSDDEFNNLMSYYATNDNVKTIDKDGNPIIKTMYDETGELCVGTGYYFNWNYIKSLSDEERRNVFKPALSKFYNELNEQYDKKHAHEDDVLE